MRVNINNQTRTWQVKSGDLLTIPSGKVAPRKIPLAQAEGWSVFFATTAHQSLLLGC